MSELTGSFVSMRTRVLAPRPTQEPRAVRAGPRAPPGSVAVRRGAALARRSLVHGSEQLQASCAARAAAAEQRRGAIQQQASSARPRSGPASPSPRVVGAHKSRTLFARCSRRFTSQIAGAAATQPSSFGQLPTTRQQGFSPQPPPRMEPPRDAAPQARNRQMLEEVPTIKNAVNLRCGAVLAQLSKIVGRVRRWTPTTPRVSQTQDPAGVAEGQRAAHP